VVIAEGKTEMGICRALNIYRVSQKLKNTAILGIRLAEGKGSQCFEYCKSLAKANFATALFCDSDEADKKNKKEELRKLGVTIIDWEENDDIELAVAKYLPFSAIGEVLELASNIRQEEDSATTFEEAQKYQWDAVTRNISRLS
jgi:hypothetical protein